MAAVARDQLDVIRIPRKVILAEVLKKINGREAHYQTWSSEGCYQSTVRTIIAAREENTSGKFEEATGYLAATTSDAEEEAALALLESLKKTYKFEMDDMNFIPCAQNERRKEQLQKGIRIVGSMLNKQIMKVKKLSKGWSNLLDDMNFVQEVCEDVSAYGLAVLPPEHANAPETEMIHAVHCLNEWTEQKIYEGISNYSDIMDLGK